MAKPRSTKGKSGSVRIIAGKWRGRRLAVSDAPGLRPTTDRVRETLFNWLAPDLVDARCLDLFAGSGVLGLECLSRGAASCQFVEANKAVANRLRSAVEGLLDKETNNAEVAIHVGGALEFLNRPLAEKFDVIFLDPPFNSGLSQKAVNLLEQSHCLAEPALIYIERHAKAEKMHVPSTWELYREGQAGESHYQLFQYDRKLSEQASPLL